MPTTEATGTAIPDGGPAQGSSGPRSRRLLRVGYLLLVGATAAFALSFFTLAMSEAVGPSDTQSGRVIERFEGESSSTRCSRGSGCQTFTYPNYTVIGERADGTTWLVVGEPAYDATRGDSGEIAVTTSSATGRVVGLDGVSSWTVTSSGQTLFATGALIVIGGIVLLWEFARRRGRQKLGDFDRVEFAALIPAILIGLAVTWFVMFSKGWGLDAVSSSDEFGGFLDDPIAFLTDEPEPAGEGNPIPVGRWIGRSSSEVVIVGVDDLNVVYSDVIKEVGDLLVVPVMQRDTVGPKDRVQFHLVADGEFFIDGVEPTDCPDALPAFGGTSGQQGFVCFDAAAIEGRQLQSSIGNGRITSEPLSMAFDAVFI